MKEKKLFAVLTDWDGNVVEREIKREWIQDIVDAVVGQFAFMYADSGFGVEGSDFCHVDIVERSV